MPRAGWRLLEDTLGPHRTLALSLPAFPAVSVRILRKVEGQHAAEHAVVMLKRRADSEVLPRQLLLATSLLFCVAWHRDRGRPPQCGSLVYGLSHCEPQMQDKSFASVRQGTQVLWMMKGTSAPLRVLKAEGAPLSLQSEPH